MVLIRLMVCLQRHIKVFRYITTYGSKCLKRNLTYIYIAFEINIGHSHTQNHVSYKKLHKMYKYYIYRLTQKFSDTFHPTVKNFQNALKHIYIPLDIMKLTFVILMHKTTLPLKNVINSINILYTDSYEKFQ